MPRLILTALLALCAVAPAQEKKHYVLYAMLIRPTTVRLTDDSKWEMDQGDTFPVVMFKDRQTKVILRLAATSFIVDAERVQTIEEKDLTEAQLASYRSNLNKYLDSRTEKWKEQAK